MDGILENSKVEIFRNAEVLANILGIQGLKHPWPKRLTSLHEQRKTSAYVSEWRGFACISVPFPTSRLGGQRKLREWQSGGGAEGGGGGGDEKHLLRTSVNTRCSVYFRTMSPVSYCIRIAYLFIVTSRGLPFLVCRLLLDKMTPPSDPSIAWPLFTFHGETISYKMYCHFFKLINIKSIIFNHSII